MAKAVAEMGQDIDKTAPREFVQGLDDENFNANTSTNSNQITNTNVNTTNSDDSFERWKLLVEKRNIELDKMMQETQKKIAALPSTGNVELPPRSRWPKKRAERSTGRMDTPMAEE